MERRRRTFGVFAFPQVAPIDRIVATARRSEELGFDNLWVADQTSMAKPGYLGFEAWTLLGALARETTTIELGPLVSPAVFRHPLLLAMAVTTLDHASAGRAVLGIGAGGVQPDLAGVGADDQPRRALVDRLGEQLPVIDRLLRGEVVDAVGEHFSMRNAVVEQPVRRPRPPIVVAAQSGRTLRLAAEHADVWSSVGGQPVFGERVSMAAAIDATRRDLEAVDEACVTVGREPASLRRSVLAFRTDAYASFDSLVDWVGRYLELGFDDVVVHWIGDADHDARVERFATDVMPQLRSPSKPA